MKQSDWEYDAVFQQPRKGLKQQILTTYEIRNNKMIKTVVTRNFYGKDDYQDSTRTEVICDAAN